MDGKAEKLGETARAVRERAGLRAVDIATIADVSEATVSRFEAGLKLTGSTEAIVAAYEEACRLEPGELWRRAFQ